MKNLAKNAGLLFIALGALCVTSCDQKDDLNTNDGKPVETTKVNFAVTSAQQLAGKIINRDDVPLYVDNVTINAASASLNPFTATETFSFSAAPDASLPHGFSLGNVALGTNTFTATSTSAAANKKLGFQTPVVGAGQNGLDVMKTATPYIVCASAPVQAVITKTGNTPVNLAMDTNNGRILARFIQETPDADNYTVRITATQGGFSQTESMLAFNGSTKHFAWSNENAVTGATVTFTINIYEKTLPGAPFPGTLLNTITKTVTIQKAKNIMATFTIHNTDVHTDLADGGIVLTFPTIEDVIIND